MKKLIQTVMVLVTILYSKLTIAQAPVKNAGLYKSENDFVTSKLTCAFDCSGGAGSIKLHNFFGSSKVDVIANGKKFSFSKNEVFGFHDCNGKNYRFYKNLAFEIIDTDGFYVYRQYSYQPGKSSTRVNSYYFSKDGGSIIEPLTVSNLSSVFAANTKFRYAIAGLGDNKLSEYDNYSSRYKIKYLYAESLKN